MDVGRFIHYKINIKVIQDEHSLILQQFRDCFTELEEKKNIEHLLNYIYEILLSHFKNEEKFMVMIDYPYLDNHTKEHKKLGFYFRKNIDQSQLAGTQNRFLVAMLQEEFLKHIDEQDKQIETFYFSDK